MEKQRRPFPLCGLYLHRPVEHAHALFHVHQAVSDAGGIFPASLLLKESASVVGNRDFTEVGEFSYRHLTFRSVGVFEDVVDCFLDDPENLNLLHGSEFSIEVFDLAAELCRRRNGILPYGRFDGFLQAEPVEHMRMEIERDLADLFDGALKRIADLLHLAAQSR